MNKILLCGRSRVAAAILWHITQSDHSEIVGFVKPKIDDFVSESIDFCQKNRITVYDNHEVATIETNPDFILSIYYDRIFKPEFISKNLLILNVHNSLLPKYRGVRPIDFALLNNERELGVTIHKIDSGIDTGDILAQASFESSPLETPSTAREKCFNLAIPLVLDVLMNFPSKIPLKQNWKGSSYYSKDDLWKLEQNR